MFIYVLLHKLQLILKNMINNKHMARKVFISVLGTGFYKPCKYTTGEFTSSNTRFIQQATIELIHVENWSADDKVLILLTDEARRLNWDQSILHRQQHPSLPEVEYTGLQKILLDMNLPTIPEGIEIPSGSNEKEMWIIFNKIFESLNEKDELYLDLTHGFRYLPMLMLVLSNYAKFLKSIKVRHLSYGNFESPTPEKPFVNLLALSALQDWSFAAANFLKNGDADSLYDLCDNSLNPILRDNNRRRDNPQATVLRDFIKSLKTVADDMRNCRGKNILDAKHMMNLKINLKKIDQNIIPPMNPIIEKIEQSFKDFSVNEDILDGYRAAKWCVDNKLYQQAITIMFENIATHVCSTAGLDWKNADQRELVNFACLIFSQKNTEENRNENEENAAILRKIINLPIMKDIAPICNSLNNLRNDFLHNGMRANCANVISIANGINKYLNELFALYIQNPSPLQTSSNFPLLFINLSNHPYDTWCEKQKDAAKIYGECKDWDFPEIDPNWDEERLNDEVDLYVKKIQKHIKEYTITLHIMGELNFCFALVERLHRLGITCVASCTKRNTTMQADGIKQSLFEFERFRKYITQ